MFSISHPRDGTFRLEIHGSLSEFSRRDARRLQSILLEFVRKLSEATEGPPTDPSSLPVRTGGDRLERERSR